MFSALLCITTFPSSDYYISSYPSCIDERSPCFRTITCHLLKLDSSLHQIHMEHQGFKACVLFEMCIAFWKARSGPAEERMSSVSALSLPIEYFGLDGSHTAVQIVFVSASKHLGFYLYSFQNL